MALNDIKTDLSFLRQGNFRANPVIVVLNLNHTGLGIIRNFSKHPFALIGLSKKESSGRFTRYVSTVVQMNVEDDPDGTLGFLLDLGHLLSQIGFIIPTSEGEIDFLSQNQRVLSQYYTLSLPNKNVLSNFLDKYILHQELVKHNLPSPQTKLLEGVVSGDDSCKLHYPCIIKPAFSGTWKTSSAYALLGDKKAIVIQSQDELEKHYRLVSQLSRHLIIQDIVDAKEDIYSFCCFGGTLGEVLWGFVTQKLLQYPPQFGTALLCQVTEDREIFELGKSVIETLGIDGIAEVEIIRDKKGQLYVIEINTRHWQQHRLSSCLGVNISLLDYYYRAGDMLRVEEILSHIKPKHEAPIWIDDLGYLMHCFKSGFSPSDCRVSHILGRQREFSTFSLVDWRPFYYRVKSTFAKGI